MEKRKKLSKVKLVKDKARTVVGQPRPTQRIPNRKFEKLQSQMSEGARSRSRAAAEKYLAELD